jgi:thioredoxin reductase
MDAPTPNAPFPTLPVAVVGAGPIGLVAAAHLVARGETPLLLEAGDAVGASVREWGHVRLFSPWKYLTDPVSRRMLEAEGWQPPPADHLPTGMELVREFLEPLAALPSLVPHLHLEHRVTAVTRRGFDKARSPGRGRAPFELVIRRGDGGTERRLARAVIDASGTWNTPNPMGAGGLPAEGEAELRHAICHGIPDIRGTERSRYAGRRTLVVGSGHSAFHAVLELVRLREEAPGSEATWAVRRSQVDRMFGNGPEDVLPARGGLGERLRDLVETGAVRFRTGFQVRRLEKSPRGILVTAEDGMSLGPVDEVIVATGFRPEPGLLRELRTGLDPSLEAPARLAPLIDPNVHGCGSVRPHGFHELTHPEPDLFVVGMKSYGRAPTFLLATGYEQVRSVVSGLTGDLEGARRVELVLPRTGACAPDTVEGNEGKGSRPDAPLPVPAGSGGPACCA